ncbi:hypothetical protein ACS0TY_028710 [Phlomoides rotata]
MNSGRCAACKHLRRRCPSDCIFSPYFPSNNPRRFSYVHKIYGASNVGKILQDLPVNRRAEAAESLYYEAHCRIKDPVHGCVGIITILHQEIYKAECELARVEAQINATIINHSSQQQQQHHHHLVPDQNAAFTSTPSYDLSTCFN